MENSEIVRAGHEVQQELLEVQKELLEVKKALSDGTGYLGMRDAKLTQYFLNLNDKENLIMSRQIKLKMGGGVSRGVNGGSGVPAGVTEQARPPPPGETRTFDKENLEAVIAHTRDYEGDAVECVKTLRALSALSYSSAATVGQSEAVELALRLGRLHPGDAKVRLALLRMLCNVAYDTPTAMNKLAMAPVFALLFSGMSEPNEVGLKACETLARIVAEDGGRLLGRVLGAWTHLHSDTNMDTPCKLIDQLITNEVVDPAKAGAAICSAGSTDTNDAESAARWLRLVKKISMERVDLGVELINGEALERAILLMDQFLPSKDVQVAAIEAMSAVVGHSWDGLKHFATSQGMKRIEIAMLTHPGDALVQMKGMRACASGVSWPEHNQEAAGFKYSTAVELVKAAMSAHMDNVEVLLVAMEALVKYSAARRTDDLKKDGGEGLVKAILMRHKDVPQLQSKGRVVLGGMGGDRNWQPRNT
eukprot:CAMPEP_0194521536 /NCGR_PEP_ID=MMETSP0253-20130528/55859_1 /TAXON_ID=2966 /ORGANISM="Noctiluca scintillans" /LENGTH=476 /DNA_ID=CAMNT_0039365901 /DNA_START=29 /DNA_END=1459 /DNA_ORIENTATION=-